MDLTLSIMRRRENVLEKARKQGEAERKRAKNDNRFYLGDSGNCTDEDIICEIGFDDWRIARETKKQEVEQWNLAAEQRRLAREALAEAV